MSSEEISLQNGLNVFQDDPLRAYNCGPATATRPGPKTRELTGFIDDKMFSFPPSQPAEFRSSSIYAAASTDRRDPPNHHHRNWASSAGGGSTHSGDDESDGDDVEDEEDDPDDDDGGDGDENNNNNNNSSININNHINKHNSGTETVNNAGSGNPEKMGNGKAKHSFG